MAATECNARGCIGDHITFRVDVPEFELRSPWEQPK